MMKSTSRVGLAALLSISGAFGCDAAEDEVGSICSDDCGVPNDSGGDFIESGKAAVNLTTEDGGGKIPAERDVSLPEACTLPTESDIVTLVSEDGYSTAGASYAMSLLSKGAAPAPAHVQPLHFLNAFPSAYETGDDYRATIDLVAVEGDNQYLLQVALTPPQIVQSPRTVTFVVDTSKSVAENSLDIEKAALRAAVDHLNKGDWISIVTWNNVEASRVIVEGRQIGDADESLESAIDRIGVHPDGQLAPALDTAFQVALAVHGDAQDQFEGKVQSRLVFLSDGLEGFDDKADEVLTQIAADANVSLVVVGVGDPSSFVGSSLSDAAERSHGDYHFIATTEEAQTKLGTDISRTLDMAASHLTLRLDLPDYMEFLLDDAEFAETSPKLRDRALAPGGVAMFQQRVHVCDPAIFDVVELDHNISVHLSFDDFSKGAPEPREMKIQADGSKIVHEPSLGVRQSQALISVADALRAPTSARLGQAYDTLASLDQAELVDLQNLLQKHPSF